MKYGNVRFHLVVNKPVDSDKVTNRRILQLLSFIVRGNEHIKFIIVSNMCFRLQKFIKMRFFSMINASEWRLGFNRSFRIYRTIKVEISDFHPQIVPNYHFECKYLNQIQTKYKLSNIASPEFHLVDALTAFRIINLVD